MTATRTPGAEPTSAGLDGGSHDQPGGGAERDAPRSPTGGGAAPDIRARLLAAHSVAARFYQARLTTEEGTGPSAFLEQQGVPVDGPWVVGYAPDRPAALINELRRHGFSDVEIRASGLASTSGPLIDRFRNRVMIGVRDPNDSDAPVVAFAGYAPPGAPADVAATLYSPGTAIHQPSTTLFGVAEHPERTGGASIVANDPLEAVSISSRTASGDAPPLVVAPVGPRLTRMHVDALTRAADTAAGVTVTVPPGELGRRAAARAYALLAPAVTEDPERPGELLAVRRHGDLSDARPLGESVVQPTASRELPPADGPASVEASAAPGEPPAGKPASLEAPVAPGEPPAGEPASLEAPVAPGQPPASSYEQLPLDLDLVGNSAEREGLEPPVPAREAAEHPGAGREQIAPPEPASIEGSAEAAPPEADEQTGDTEPPTPAVEPPLFGAGEPAAPAADPPTSTAADHEQDHPSEAEVADHEARGAGPEARADVAADDEPPVAAEGTGHALPGDADPVKGVDGYHYTLQDRRITVYGPDNAPVTSAEYSGGGITAGEVDGVRIPGYAWGTSDFPLLAARQHRAARSPAEQRDRVWVEIVPDSTARAGHVVVVHGTVKGDARDDRATKDVAHFLWSGQKKARVSGRAWTPAKVDENFTRLLREFARQGRNVLVSQAGAGQDKTQAPAPARAAADVAEARQARMRAVDAEVDRLEEARFPNELARAKVSGRSAWQRVSIDGMPEDYGELIALPDRGFQAKVGYTEKVGYFASRPEAVAALVRHYDQNPKTLPQRTWGVPRRIALPVAARDELAKWLRGRPDAEATVEQRRLAEILIALPTQETHRNPLTDKPMRAYPYSLEEGLLGELTRIGERVTTDLREQSVNPELPRQDRDAAKRRIPTMGAALHNINSLREQANTAGIDTDRRAVDENQVAAQLAALVGDVDIGNGGSRDSEPVQPDSQTALGAVPAQGTSHDPGPGGVLREQGSGVAGGDDRSAGGAGGNAAAGDGVPGAGGSVESDSGHRGATGDDGAPAATGGRRGSAHAVESAGPDRSGPERPLTRFRPDPADTPRTPLRRAAANLEAIGVLRRLEQERRGATEEDKRILARWSGWGSVPMVFLERPDERNPAYGQGGEREGRYAQDLARWEEYSAVRDGLRELLDPFEWNTAVRATLSAHYTPQSLADAMWDGLRAFGFDGGEVLEAGSGSGAFFGAAPDSEGVRLTGVELDPTSARISQLIYPHANVLAESFADTDAPAGSFDAAIGNVPFAQVPFTERRYGASGRSLHNGFLIKELALVREGGLVMAVTSRWTLDGENDAARRQMARSGDLLAAYRLPAGVFAESAGTDVVVDVLVFRRGVEGHTPADPVWLHAPKRELNGSTHTINAYFAEHPEHVLGELTAAPGPFGPAVTVKGDPVRAVQDMRAALRQAAELAKLEGRAYEPHPDGSDRKPLNLQTAREKHATDYTGRLYIGEDGRVWQHINGAGPVEAVPSDGNTAQLRALMRLRDATAELKELDRSGDEPARADELRARVRQLHADYARQHGPLSRAGQTRLAAARHVRERARAEGRQIRDDERTPTAWGWFREDPDAATVLALESWDLRREAPVLSEVLTRRPGTHRGELERTDDPKVALAAVVGATGKVDLDRIADLLGTSPDETRLRLGTEVFDNPVTGKLEHAGAYLSGAVRRKLDEARAAAAANPTYALNVAALEAVQPREKRIGQFTPQLGAHWIPPSLVQGFLREYLGDHTLQVQHNDRYGWTLHAGKVPDAVNALKGTGRRSALQIARAVLGYGSLMVEDAVERGDKVVRLVDEDASRAARQKADVMRSAFEDYLTADSARVKVLTEAYNRVMNGHVVRNYDGLTPSLAGFTDQRTPHPHQLAGAARMQFERGVILAHEVGLGKTTTMIMGTQALKASGQIGKPFAVVQRHLAKQWHDEARFLYPNADIRLITSEMLSGDERRRTQEWLRSNTPDLTIFTEGAFTSVKMSPEYQEWYEFQDVANLRRQILRERGVPDNVLAVRKLEQRLATQEARLRRNAAPMRTPGEVYWEDLGFDYAAIDELHRFKGVGFRSKEGGGDTAKVRAVDLHQKLTYMHGEAAAQGGRPTVTGATGTPLTNSIAEQYTMLALISPWVLEEYGVAGPDLWADTFGQKVQRIEMAPDGSGLKVVERFSRFISKSTMKTMWGLTADTKTADAVGIERPRVVGGGAQLQLVEPTADQRARLKKLVARGAAIHAGEVTREQDNMLAVSSEGRAVACDPRLVDASAPPGPKLAAVADWFASRYHASKDRVYAVSSSDPTPHPVPGSLLIGFLNQGTPGGSNKGGFNAYATLRDQCVARDVPAEKIAFVQQHNQSPDKLAELYRRCREGDVSIILASTETMGTGANIQNRALALAHIDLDWTPAGIEQRDGRIVRWGNQNGEVELAIFALRGSMDSWQAGLLASKAEGLRDIQRPEIADEGDTVQEIGDVEWDYATMQAEIGGNPYMGQLMKARRYLAELEADRRNHTADRLRQSELLNEKETEAAATRQAIARRDEVIPLITPARSDDFAIQIGETDYTERKAAGRVLRREVNTSVIAHRTPGAGPWRVLGRFGGLPFGVRTEMTGSGELHAQVGFPDLRHSEALYTVEELTAEKVGGTMLSRLTTALEKARDHQALDRQRLPGLDEEIALLTQQQGVTDFTERIGHARRRVDLLDDVVAAIAERDKLPELNADSLDPEKYRTHEQRLQAITARAQERLPLQARVDEAIESLETFDREHTEAAAETAGPFTALEQATIQIAVEDHAARYFGGPAGFGRESAARYVSEGHLGALADKYGLKDVWRAVAAHIDAHPELLERSEAERAAAQTARREQAGAVDRDALAAYNAGDLDRASELIDAAELIDPDYGDKGYAWRQARQAIEGGRAKGRDGAPPARDTDAVPAVDTPDTEAANVQRVQRQRGLPRREQPALDGPGLDAF